MVDLLFYVGSSLVAPLHKPLTELSFYVTASLASQPNVFVRLRASSCVFARLPASTCVFVRLRASSLQVSCLPAAHWIFIRHVLFFPHPQTDAFQQNGHVHKAVKQRDSGQTIRPHNGRNSTHKVAISRKLAQFQEACFFAAPLPFRIDESDHFLSKRHGFYEDGRIYFRAEKTRYLLSGSQHRHQIQLLCGGMGGVCATSRALLLSLQLRHAPVPGQEHEAASPLQAPTAGAESSTRCQCSW